MNTHTFILSDLAAILSDLAAILSDLAVILSLSKGTLAERFTERPSTGSG